MSERGENRAAILVSVIGAVLGLLQVLVLFILSDMRERIMRLETNQMQRAAQVSAAVSK